MINAIERYDDIIRVSINESKPVELRRLGKLLYPIKEKQMSKVVSNLTRSEAVEIVRNDVFGVVDAGQAARWIDAFVKLGLIEFKPEPEKSDREKFVEECMRIGVHTSIVWREVIAAYDKVHK